MPLFSAKNAERLILILDVQSAIVRGSLVLMKNGTHPEIIFTHNTIIPWKPRTDSKYLTKTTLHAVSQTVNVCIRGLHDIHVTLEGVPKKIGAVHFALSSPWIVSQAKTVRVNLEKNNNAVTKAFVDKIIEDERQKMEPKDNVDVTMIEQKIFDVRLNGYSIENWIGKPAKTIEISYTLSLSGTEMIEHLKECCRSIVHVKQIFFHSSLLLQFIGIRICMPEHHTITIAHVHGELTDLAMMENYACVFFGSYEFGVRTLVRKIARSLHIEQQVADSLLSLYIGGHIDATLAEKEAKVINNVSAGWTNELKKLFDNDGGRPVTPDHFIVSAVAHDEYFMSCIRGLYPKSTCELLSIETISPHLAFSEHAERRRLTGLYAIALNSML